MKLCEILKPENFQKLARDILQIREDTILESFSPGKDSGIDYRGIINKKNVIIQVKSTKNYNALKSQLKNEEIKKLEKLKPERYILVLAISLTTKRKDEILEIFKDYIISPNDLITGEDIENYFTMEKYQHVNKKHQQIALKDYCELLNYYPISEDPFAECKDLYQDIEVIQKYFIATKSFKNAIKHIENNNIIILTGDPGAGKTTNAKMLIDYLLTQKEIDEVIELKSTNDFSKKYDYQKKQIFYFDDFWGSTFAFQKVPLNEDKQFFQMVNAISNNPNTYLILTTREYVLKQGLQYFHAQNNHYIDTRIYHNNASLSKLEKTKILMAHIANSNLDFNIMTTITYYVDEIIMKPNYSPRAIEYFINENQDKLINADKFINSFLKYLDKPYDYFKNTFYKLSEESRIISYIITISEPPTSIEKLKDTFTIIATNIPNTRIKISNFDTFINELENSFTTYNNKNKSIQFKNHSIEDFVTKEFINEFIDYKKAFIKGVKYFDQIISLLSERIKFNLLSEDIELLLNKIISNFETLSFASIEPFNYDVIDDINDLFSWKHTKIWTCLKIAKIYNNNDFTIFLKNKTIELLNFYVNKYHYYLTQNFISIPELLKWLEKLGCELDFDELSKKYLCGFSFLYELQGITYGSLKFQQACKKNFKYIKNEFIEQLPERLLVELDITSEDGISLEYEQTIEDLPKILNFFNIPMSKEVQIILDDSKIDYTTYTNLVDTKGKKSRSNEDKQKEDYVKKIRQSFYQKQYIKKNNFIKLLNKLEGLSYSEKDKIKKSFYSSADIFCFPNELTNNYIQLIYDYYQETKDIDTSWNLFPKLTKYISNKIPALKIESLYNYAYHLQSNDCIALSKKHLITQYQITEEQIKQLINIGAFGQNYNLIYFTDNLFEMYLSTMYFVNNKNIDFQTYKTYLNDKNIFSTCDILLFEYFDTNRFNNLFLKEIFNNIEILGFDNFLKEISEIEIEKEDQGYSTTSTINDYYCFYDLFAFNYFNIGIFENIIEMIEESEWAKKQQKYKIMDFLDDKSIQNTTNYQKIIEVCKTYYNLAKSINNKLSKLKDNEKLKFDKNDILI